MPHCYSKAGNGFCTGPFKNLLLYSPTPNAICEQRMAQLKTRNYTEGGTAGDFKKYPDWLQLVPLISNKYSAQLREFANDFMSCCP